MSHWNYKGKPFNFTEEEIKKDGLYGFVYIMHFMDTGRKYVGRKYFWSKRTLKPLKGKKNKRHVTKESDWRTYQSSSDDIKQLLTEGNCNIEYEIVSLHPNKSETNYSEIKLQFALCVLEEQDSNGEYVYMNKNINMKYYRSAKFVTERQFISEHYSNLR